MMAHPGWRENAPRRRGQEAPGKDIRSGIVSEVAQRTGRIGKGPAQPPGVEAVWNTFIGLHRFHKRSPGKPGNVSPERTCA